LTVCAASLDRSDPWFHQHHLPDAERPIHQPRRKPWPRAVRRPSPDHSVHPDRPPPAHSFLFLVGIEVDFSLFRRNAKLSSSISLVGLIVPFALGAAISKGIYERFIDDAKVHFGTFLLFIATAMAITA
jgi:hypothetical protein